MRHDGIEEIVDILIDVRHFLLDEGVRCPELRHPFFLLDAAKIVGNKFFARMVIIDIERIVVLFENIYVWGDGASAIPHEHACLLLSLEEHVLITFPRDGAKSGRNCGVEADGKDRRRGAVCNLILNAEHQEPHRELEEELALDLACSLHIFAHEDALAQVDDE